MTNIVGIDSAFLPWQTENGQQPVEDFAHELAKPDEPENMGAQDKTGSRTGMAFDGRAMPAANPPAPSSLADSLQGIAPGFLQAGTWSDVQQLALATVAPTGVTEALLGARVFGWHAMTQAYLSELTLADQNPRPKATTSEQQAEAIGAALSESAASLSSSTAVPTAAVADMPAAAHAEGLVYEQPRYASGGAMSADAADLSADAAAVGYWSERSMRYTRQRDGSSVAWLRDFRISDAEASRLIQFVLSDAQEKGLALSKIMLNGREAWASPSGNQGAHDVG